MPTERPQKLYHRIREILESARAGMARTNLRWFRQFYLLYPQLLSSKIHHVLRDELPAGLPARIFDIPTSESWKPGCLNPNVYKLYLPTEAELKAEIQRGLRSLSTEVTQEALPARKRGRGKMDHRFW